jgi:pilus assembly protein CpaB
MRKQALIPLAIGMIVGLVALKLGYDYVGKMKRAQVKPAGPSSKVVVAARELSFGTALQESDFKVVDMPVNLVPKNSASDYKDFVGQTLRTTLSAGMPIMNYWVGPGQGFEGVIPEGYRAVSVKVDEFTGVAGLLQPGDRVDVVATLKIKNADTADTVSKIILQNILVRAVGRQYREEKVSGAESKLSRSVTLLLQPSQVETLQLASSMGDVSLALRAGVDDKYAQTMGVNCNKLLSDSEGGLAEHGGWLNKFFQAKAEKVQPIMELANAPAKPPYIVEVYTGNQYKQLYFASPNSDVQVCLPSTVQTKDNSDTNTTDKSTVVPRSDI